MSEILNPNSAGIDIASKIHYVAVPKNRTERNVREFKSFTRDLHDLAKWLKECKIETVAMESTGIYWYDLYTILLDYGIEVYLVNAHHVKNVPGRKTDVSDAQWLQQLHSFGLLRSCFQPDNLTRELRNYVRVRKQIVQQMAKETQRMQKALGQMNIKLDNVIRDINGKTGKAIIEKILQGERSAEKLAEHKEPGIKASKETLVKSLEANWREEQLFNLKMAMEHYTFFEKQLQKCDGQSENTIRKMEDGNNEKKSATKTRKQKNQPKFNVEQHLYNALGTEVTKIYGIKSTTALTIFSETGPNLKEKFPTVKQFLSWLNVVPDNKISGGKILSSKVRKRKNKAGMAFRDAAGTLWRAQNPLGDYLRVKKSKTGGNQAIVATARKLASIYYYLVTEKKEFDPDKLVQNKKKNLQKKAAYYKRKLENIENEFIDYQHINGSVI